MVVLWLIAGVSSRRCLDPKPLPFSGGKRVRRTVQQSLQSKVVLDAIRDSGSDLLAGKRPYLYGAVDVAAEQVYSHVMRLTPADREQYFHWRSVGVPAADLWCFRIEGHVALPQPLLATNFIAKRFKKIYSWLENDSVLELCSSLDSVPFWLRQQMQLPADQLHMAVLMPEPLLVLCFQDSFDKLLLPAPAAAGWWRAPRWFNRMFTAGLQHHVDAFRADRIAPSLQKTCVSVLRVVCLATSMWWPSG